MNPTHKFRQYLQVTAMLLAAAGAGCGGGQESDTAQPSGGEVVGAPLGNPPAKAPSMGIPEPVPRYTALAVAAQADGEELAIVWVRGKRTSDLAPVGETTVSDPQTPDFDATGSPASQ